MKFPNDIDKECIPICAALNALPGIQTIESCCGHGQTPHRIFFTAEEVQNLRPILRASHSSAWHVEAGWANGSDIIYFLLQGPIGPADLPGGADDFASWLRDFNPSAASTFSPPPKDQTQELPQAPEAPRP